MLLRTGGVLFLLIVVPALTYRREEPEKDGSKHDVTGLSYGTRMKRSVRVLGKLGAAGAAVWRGIKATNLLLDGAKRLPRVKNVDKLYMKRGDYTNAKKDFFSVDPTDVQKLQRGMIGRIGDRFVRLVEGEVNSNTFLIIGKVKDIGKYDFADYRFKTTVIEYNPKGTSTYIQRND